MDMTVEAWLDRTKPTEIATPLYQYTSTTINFTVLNAARTAVNLQGYAGKFSLKAIDTEEIITDKAISIVTANQGRCKAVFTSANLANTKECLGELRLWSDGNTSHDVTHRIQFRFNIFKANVQGAGA